MPQSGLPRNVHVYDYSNNSNPPLLVAGFQQLGHTISKMFYFCLEICFQHPPPSRFQLRAADRTILSRDSSGTLVPQGDYYVVTTGMDAVSSLMIRWKSSLHVGCPRDEGRSPRNNFWRKSNKRGGTMSNSLAFVNGKKTSIFRDPVRERDQSCVVSTTDTRLFGDMGLEACHIFPRSHYDHAS
jgi:hypothetical protein